MAIVRNAGKGGPLRKWNEVVKDALNNCGLDRDLVKDRERWKAYGENVRPVQAWTRDVKREERERLRSTREWVGDIYDEAKLHIIL